MQIPKVRQDRKVFLEISLFSSFEWMALIKKNGKIKPAIIPAIQRNVSITSSSCFRNF